MPYTNSVAPDHPSLTQDNHCPLVCIKQYHILLLDSVAPESNYKEAQADLERHCPGGM